MRKLNRPFIFLLIASLILSACAGAQATTAPATSTPEMMAEEPTTAPEVQPSDTPQMEPTATEAAAPTEAAPTEAAAPTQAPAPPVVVLPDLDGREIAVAVENAYPPFNNIDEASGEGVGWDYDAVREICARLNCTPNFTQAAWDGIFPAMAAGEFDMLADGATYTTDRDKEVDFSIPYVNVIQMLLVRADETATLEEIKADTSRLVGTQIATTNEIVAKQFFTDERVQSFEDFGAAVLALLSGDIDGVVIDNVSATGYMQANEGQMKVIGELTSNEQLAFVFPPSSDLIWPVNAALESMKADGTLLEINQKWGLSQ
jgi:polar amino acid transport system substrate-binding protein